MGPDRQRQIIRPNSHILPIERTRTNSPFQRILKRLSNKNKYSLTVPFSHSSFHGNKMFATEFVTPWRVFYWTIVNNWGIELVQRQSYFQLFCRGLLFLPYVLNRYVYPVLHQLSRVVSNSITICTYPIVNTFCHLKGEIFGIFHSPGNHAHCNLVLRSKRRSGATWYVILSFTLMLSSALIVGCVQMN